MKISLVALMVTALAQAAIVLYTGSVALLADTIHNFSDALTAVPLWIAFVLGRRAASRRYTYGYGRAEDLAGVFIVAMIALSAVLAGYESIRRLIDPQPVTHVAVVIAAGLIGTAGNELVAYYRIRVGRTIGSAALVADGLHARTDGLTSLAVVLGALGILAGFPLADPRRWRPPGRPTTPQVPWWAGWTMTPDSVAKVPSSTSPRRWPRGRTRCWRPACSTSGSCRWARSRTACGAPASPSADSGCDAGRPCVQPCGELGAAHRARQVVTLRDVAAELAKR